MTEHQTENNSQNNKDWYLFYGDGQDHDIDSQKKMIKEKNQIDKKSFAALKNRELQRIRDKWGDIV